jgi:hypothetical protein
MSYREHYSLNAEERAAHERKWGGGNDFPPGWRKIEEAEFAQSDFFTYAPELVEFRQMINRKDNKPAMSAHLYFMWNGRGYSIVNDFWAKKVSYFAFGCDHDYERDPEYKPAFNCDNGFRCKKCGHKFSVDSSD